MLSGFGSFCNASGVPFADPLISIPLFFLSRGPLRHQCPPPPPFFLSFLPRPQVSPSTPTLKVWTPEKSRTTPSPFPPQGSLAIPPFSFHSLLLKMSKPTSLEGYRAVFSLPPTFFFFERASFWSANPSFPPGGLNLLADPGSQHS